MYEKVKLMTKVRNVIGGCLIFLHNGTSFYWGNLSIYVTSYTLAQTTSLSNQLASPSWVFSFALPFWLLGMFSSGYLSKFINVRILMGFAIFIENLSFFVTYFLLDISLSAVYIVFGILAGFGAGFYEGNLQQHFILNLSERHASLFCTVVMSGGPVGGIFINQFVTWYTNPSNLSPEFKSGSMHLFTQEEIISKVPVMLLIIAICLSTMQTVGLILLQEIRSNRSSSSTTTPATITTTTTTETTTTSSSTSSRPILSPQDQSTKLNKSTTSNGASADTLTESSLILVNNDSIHVKEKCVKNYTPSEMLRSRTFYFMFVVCILGSSSRIIGISYYKIYGQIWINDDHFLTNLGTVQVISEIPGMVVWGYVIDRIGVTSYLVIMYAGSSLSLLAMYFSARLDRWLYFISAVLVCLIVNTYTCFSIATFKWFGKAFYTVNTAIVKSAATLGITGTTLMLDSFIARFGHFFEFGLAASSCAVALVIIVASFPRK